MNRSGPKGEGRFGRSGGRGGCSRNVLYERRIKITKSREGLDVILDSVVEVCLAGWLVDSISGLKGRRDGETRMGTQRWGSMHLAAALSQSLCDLSMPQVLHDKGKHFVYHVPKSLPGKTGDSTQFQYLLL